MSCTSHSKFKTFNKDIKKQKNKQNKKEQFDVNYEDEETKRHRNFSEDLCMEKKEKHLNLNTITNNNGFDKVFFNRSNSKHHQTINNNNNINNTNSKMDHVK
jgi:hypothetical protein